MEIGEASRRIIDGIIKSNQDPDLISSCCLHTWDIVIFECF